MKKLNNKRKSPLEVARQYGHNNIHFNYKSTGASPTLFKLKKDKYKINNPTVDNSLKEKEKFKEHDVLQRDGKKYKQLKKYNKSIRIEHEKSSYFNKRKLNKYNRNRRKKKLELLKRKSSSSSSLKSNNYSAATNKTRNMVGIMITNRDDQINNISKVSNNMKRYSTYDKKNKYKNFNG